MTLNSSRNNLDSPPPPRKKKEGVSLPKYNNDRIASRPGCKEVAWHILFAIVYAELSIPQIGELKLLTCSIFVVETLLAHVKFKPSHTPHFKITN